MKAVYILIILALFTTISDGCAQQDSVFVCDVKFSDPKFNNPHAGSGFLLSYQGKVYGVTAKHVLFFAKTDNMKTISFGNELDSWSFKSKKENGNSVLAGKLLNENINEAIAMPPVGDWLIFEINGEIPSDMVIYTLREKPLSKGESLHFLGFPYKSNQYVSVDGKFVGFTQEKNLRLDVPKGIYGGCSGGPVLDIEGRLVGIVSMGYFNEKENKMIFEPASLDYFKKVMNSLIQDN